uniref:Dynein light chain n=1 Tax=Aegilops tauschii subsp. strangulata TaxID=200361 RepID=A0A453NYP9_AEGTS
GSGIRGARAPQPLPQLAHPPHQAQCPARPATSYFSPGAGDEAGAGAGALAHPPHQAHQNLVEAKVVVEDREVKEGDGKGKEERKVSVRVRAADMPVVLQRRAIRLAYDAVSATPRADGKRLALALKKEFDTSYGPAWHCIVGTSFGSYVTHTLGGFLYFSVDKVHILLFRTAVEPLGHLR